MDSVSLAHQKPWAGCRCVPDSDLCMHQPSTVGCLDSILATPTQEGRCARISSPNKKGVGQKFQQQTKPSGPVDLIKKHIT